MVAMWLIKNVQEIDLWNVSTGKVGDIAFDVKKKVT